MNFNKYISILIVFLLVVTNTLFFSTVSAQNIQIYNGTINENSVNIRSGPGLNYSVILKLSKYDEISILEAKNDWTKAKTKNGTIGWVSNKFVNIKQTSNLNTIKTSLPLKGMVNVDSLRLRQGPSTSHAVITTLKKNTSVDVISTEKDWQKVSANKKVGYVKKEFISIKEQANNNPVITPLPDTPNTNTNTNINKLATVTATALFIRTGPNTLSKIVHTLKLNDKVTVIKQYNGEWYEVSHKNFKGYSAAKYIEIDKIPDPVIPDVPTPNPNNNLPPSTQVPSEDVVGFIKYKAKVTVPSLNIRDNNLGNGNILGTLVLNEEVKVIASENNWCRIDKFNLVKAYVACWYLEKIEIPNNPTNERYVHIIYDSTNIRNLPGIDGQILQIATPAHKFRFIEEVNNWYKIELAPEQFGYVAGWLVSFDQEKPAGQNPNITSYVKGKKIVIDPGHGGVDSGAVGVNRTLEKTINLVTSLILKDKLEQLGAKVILTRHSDVYVSLKNRVTVSHNENADAFLSVHYDSYTSASTGISTYYYTKNKDYNLASLIQNELVLKTGQKNRGVFLGNYQVIRDNKRPSSLLELGFLSNPKEEMLLITDSYQNNITTGVVEGLNKFFVK